jgi:membrane associated rhomboid family serine protease
MDQIFQSGATIIFAATLIASFLGLFSNPKIIDAGLFRPYWFLRSNQYHTIISAGFLHADLSHLLFNMFTFYFFAFDLERHIGAPRFILLYVTGLILSHTCTYFKHKENRQYASLGASGAISAVLFAYIVYFPTTTLIILPIPIPIPAVLFAIGYVAYSYWAARQQRGQINHDAHLCGAISGLIFVGATDPAAFANLAQWMN